MNIRFIKELGAGWRGVVYLIDIDGEEFVYKLERFDQYNEEEPLTSEYHRQIKFNEDIAINHPDKFMVLKSHGIKKNHDFEHPKHNFFMEKFGGLLLEKYLRKTSHPDCHYLIHCPLLEGSFAQIQSEIYTKPNLFLDFLYQIIDSINIMRKKGYSHNDLHGLNIMYKKRNDGYQWYIIDYGSICNKSFPISEHEKDSQAIPLFCHDLLLFINHSVCQGLNKFVIDNVTDKKPFIENIQKEPEYREILLIVDRIPNISTSQQRVSVTQIVTKILYPQLYIKCIAKDDGLWKKYNGGQLYKELLIYCLEHHNDENYDGILNKIGEWIAIESSPNFPLLKHEINKNG